MFAVKAGTPSVGRRLTLLGSGILMACFSASKISSCSNDEEFQIKVIGKSEDFVDGQMKQVQVGEDKEKDIILVVRYEGKLYAVGAKCTHFGAPLATGMLFDDLVICPWHFATFDIKTGNHESGPVVDALPRYEISEKNGEVSVTVPKKITVNGVPLPAVKRDPENKTRFVILGGGPAGACAAESLRQSGFTGEIILLTAEKVLPYDRSALTKGLLKIEPQGIALRGQEYYDSLGIEVRTSTWVEQVDPSAKEVHVKGGSNIHYDKLLVATGARPKTLNVPGKDLKGIHTIRNFDDVYQIREAVKNAKNVLIIGGGLIGAEAASNLKLDLKDQVNITLLSRSDAPLDTRFGPEVGGAVKKLAEENGIKFAYGQIAQFEGSDHVTKAKLQDGQEIPVDLVITAIGVTPNTEFLKGVALDKDGGVNADIFLRSSNQKDIFAAGDLVSYPYFYENSRIRVEHLSEAYNHGTHAAWNMLGKMIPYNGVPFFWTRQWNKSVACVGYLGKGWDNIVIDGKPGEYNFAAYYFRNGRVIGAAGMMRSKDLMAINHAIRLNMPVTQEYFNGSTLDVERLRKEMLAKGPKCHCHRATGMSAPCRD